MLLTAAKSMNCLCLPLNQFYICHPFTLTDWACVYIMLQEDAELIEWEEYGLKKKNNLWCLGEQQSIQHVWYKEEWSHVLCWKMTPRSKWFHTYHPAAPRTPRGKTHPLTCKRGETRKSMTAHSIISQLTEPVLPLFPPEEMEHHFISSQCV